MATYPTTLIQVIGSKELTSDGTEVDTAVSGKPRLRTFYSQTRKAFTVVHECYSEDKNSLLAFFEANRVLVIDFVWQGDGQTYNCRFVGPPQCTPVQGDGYWSITTQLVVV